MSDLDLIGEFLMARVRDSVIHDVHAIVSNEMRGALAESDRKAIAGWSGTGAELVDLVAPRVVDRALATLLQALEEQAETLCLAVRHGDNWVSVQELSDGLAGELYGDDGWIARYSSFPDPYSE